MFSLLKCENIQVWYAAAIFKIMVVYDATLVKEVDEVVFNIELINSMLGGIADHTGTED